MTTLFLIHLLALKCPDFVVIAKQIMVQLCELVNVRRPVEGIDSTGLFVCFETYNKKSSK